MPIDGTILGLQRRDAPLGEIRMGDSVEVPGKKGRQPVRLETFRFTSSEPNIRAVAAKYGGEAVPWPRRKGKWTVTTDRAALDVWVPPAGLAVDTNMEMWDGAIRRRQCDGRTERISGKPCSCPRPSDPSDPASVLRALDERHRLAGLRPPQACKTLTRMNLTIPDLPGITGTWRLNTGSENAAVETAGAANAMTIARGDGVYLPALLYFQWRYRADDGSPYVVPFLQIGMSMEELARGLLPAGAGGLLAQLQAAAAGQRPALAADRARAITTGAAAPAGEDGVITGTVVDGPRGVDWLVAALGAAAVLTDADSGRKLWRESAAMARAGQVAGTAAGRVQEAITARLAHLRAEAAAREAALDAADPWAVKVEGLTSPQDAADALAELDELQDASAVDPGRASRVRAAITARFPQAEPGAA
jgi:Recombination directionality factor-like